MHDIIEQETPNQLDDKQLNTNMHYFDAETASVLPLPPTTPTTTASSQPAKCRLPLPSFSVDKSVSAAIPVNEKIANVIRKRQSMSDSNRSKGCRIPMLCILQPVIELVVVPVIEEPIIKQPRLRSVKSVRLPPQQQRSLSGTSENMQITRKPLSRSNTVPSHTDQNMKSPTRQIKSPLSNIETKPSQKRASPRSPLNDIKTNIRKPKISSPQPSPTQKAKKELPPKSSIYRHKRLPAGESRTARLMMGVSTTGRRQSFRQREDTNEKELSPTLGYRFGKLFNKKELDNKKRPMSFAASSSSLLVRSNTEIPSPIKSIPNKDSPPRSRRQSVPIPPTKMLEDANKNNKKSNNGIKSSIKALRVH